MNVLNKLEGLSLASLSSLMFVGKVRTYLSEAPFKWSTLG